MIGSVRFGQFNNQLVIAVHTRGRWSPRALAAAPGRSLCLLLLRRSLPGPGTAVCVSPRLGGSLTATPLGPKGRASGHTLTLTSATFTRPDARSFSAKLPPSANGVRPGVLRWLVRSTWAGMTLRQAKCCQS